MPDYHDAASRLLRDADLFEWNDRRLRDEIALALGDAFQDGKDAD